MSSTLPLQFIALMITALVLLSKRFVGIIKGSEVASELLISVVGRVLVRVMRLFAKKQGYAPFSSSRNLKFCWKIARTRGISKVGFEREGDEVFMDRSLD